MSRALILPLCSIKTVGQGGLAVVDMGDNGKVADAGRFCHADSLGATQAPGSENAGFEAHGHQRSELRTFRFKTGLVGAPQA